MEADDMEPGGYPASGEELAYWDEHCPGCRNIHCDQCRDDLYISGDAPAQWYKRDLERRTIAGRGEVLRRGIGDV